MTDSTSGNADNRLIACRCCGLVQQLPTTNADQRLLCSRCHTNLTFPRGGSQRKLAWSRSAALAALLAYVPAITLPALSVERFGHQAESSIWSGMMSLFTEGHAALGMVVLLCSLLIPVGKLLGLWIVASPSFLENKKHRAMTYHLIAWAGRWGMIDVLLIAVLVAILKLGDLVTVHPGPGATAFTVCVICSVLASACFDPHAIWEPNKS